jgi:release factor glutamine methyltransferase
MDQRERHRAGGEDGLDFIRQISHVALVLGSSGSQLMLEHGEFQGPAIRELLSVDSWRSPQTFQDLTGCDRYTTATHP